MVFPHFVLGFDMGATRTKAALVDVSSSQIRAELVFPTSQRGLQDLADEYARAAERLISQANVARADLTAVGVGVPGFVDGLHVSMVWPAIKFLEGDHLVPALEDALQLPAVIDNDGRVVAVGESAFGGHGGARLLSLTLGTGVGVALVVDGHLQEKTSATHLAAHFPLRLGTVPCHCGFEGCFESLVGAEQLGPSPEHALQPSSPSEPRTTWLRDLAAGVNGLIHIYAPDVIVLGGGVAEGLAPHLHSLTSQLFARPFRDYHVDVRLSSLGASAGMLGAAALASDMH